MADDLTDDVTADATDDVRAVPDPPSAAHSDGSAGGSAGGSAAGSSGGADEGRKVHKKKLAAGEHVTATRTTDGPKLTSATTDKHEGEVRRVRTSGRVTEKGTVGPQGKPKPAASTRYTPPVERPMDMPSPWYIPAVMFTLWGVGILLIFLNYVELLPGAQTNWYLLGGLGAILAGIIVATQYR